MVEERRGVRLPLPEDFIDETVLTKNLIKHDLDVSARVPVAMVVERPSSFQDAGEFVTARTHELEIGCGRSIAVLKGTFLPLLLIGPEHFIVPTRIERRIDIDQVNAASGSFGSWSRLSPQYTTSVSTRATACSDLASWAFGTVVCFPRLGTLSKSAELTAPTAMWCPAILMAQTGEVQNTDGADKER